jgi:hypothetical protein
MGKTNLLDVLERKVINDIKIVDLDRIKPNNY